MNIIWSDQALRDLRAIHDYVARDSLHYANLLTDRLISRVERTSLMPSVGHPVHEFLATNLREVHEGNHRIIYRQQKDELQIVTLVHMKQQISKKRLPRQ